MPEANSGCENNYTNSADSIGEVCEASNRLVSLEISSLAYGELIVKWVLRIVPGWSATRKVIICSTESTICRAFA